MIPVFITAYRARIALGNVKTLGTEHYLVMKLANGLGQSDRPMFGFGAGYGLHVRR